MSAIPTSIKRDDYSEALRLLGVPDRDVFRVVVDPGKVVVHRRRRDSAGQLVTAKDGFVTETTEIAVKGD